MTNDAILYVKLPHRLKARLERAARERAVPVSILVRLMLAEALKEMEGGKVTAVVILLLTVILCAFALGAVVLHAGVCV